VAGRHAPVLLPVRFGSGAYVGSGFVVLRDRRGFRRLLGGFFLGHHGQDECGILGASQIDEVGDEAVRQHDPVGLRPSGVWCHTGDHAADDEAMPLVARLPPTACPRVEAQEKQPVIFALTSRTGQAAGWFCALLWKTLRSGKGG